MNEDKQYLKLLSIFHYVVGAMTALFSCVLTIIVLMKDSVRELFSASQSFQQMS